MRLQPASTTLAKKSNPNLDNQEEEELSFMLPVEPIPQPEKSIPCPAPKCPPATGHSRDDSFEFSSTSSPPPSEPDQEIIFCGRILTGQRITDPNYDAYDEINGYYTHRAERRVVVHIAPADFDHCLYSDPPSANTTPLRPLLMGRNAGRSKSFNHRHESKTASSKPKLGQSKSFCYLSKRAGGAGGGLAKVSPKLEEEGKKTVAAGEGEVVGAGGGGGGRGFGRSKSFRKSVSFSSCFPIVSGGRTDF